METVAGDANPDPVIVVIPPKHALATEVADEIVTAGAPNETISNIRPALNTLLPLTHVEEDVGG